ncbi:MBL fold metallo-hydrolase [Arthrobacter sp. MMS18-M83]|uniref:MBL fold metallo-hydrolase n=1 Tax=Arthrobacter sp. MMS18-M83 TaxID=2996261 RepID=UPI00227A0F84|nr:MBL fold metallo-hydrolase [Arthrobacter sp. MMS18-M83]WAH99127.1 MBL fold metallo-hydrolase [Arthrobacter sp. MMS18-M83]
MEGLLTGRIYRLGGDIELDERVSWCPPGIRRTQAVNCYLIKGPSGSVLVDTGVRLHQADIIEQLDRLLSPGEPLSIVLTRTEMECCLNIPAIEERFTVGSVWYTGGITVPRSKAESKRIAVDPGSSMRVKVMDGVVVELVSPLLRLLPTLWVFDPESGGLLTSDAFTHGGSAVPEAREGLRKFRWFSGADTGPIARNIRDIFRNRDVRAVGPSYGTPFGGTDMCLDQAGELARAIEEMGIQ